MKKCSILYFSILLSYIGCQIATKHSIKRHDDRTEKKYNLFTLQLTEQSKKFDPNSEFGLFTGIKQFAYQFFSYKRQKNPGVHTKKLVDVADCLAFISKSISELDNFSEADKKTMHAILDSPAFFDHILNRYVNVIKPKSLYSWISKLNNNDFKKNCMVKLTYTAFREENINLYKFMLKRSCKDKYIGLHLENTFGLKIDGLYAAVYLVAHHDIEKFKVLMELDNKAILKSDNYMKLREYTHLRYDGTTRFNGVNNLTVALIAAATHENQFKKEETIRCMVEMNQAMLDRNPVLYPNYFEEMITFLFESNNNNDTYTADLNTLPDSIKLLKPSEALDDCIRIIKTYEYKKASREYASFFRPSKYFTLFRKLSLNMLYKAIDYDNVKAFNALLNVKLFKGALGTDMSKILCKAAKKQKNEIMVSILDKIIYRIDMRPLSEERAEEVCGICLEHTKNDGEKEEKPLQTSCGHVFHETCIEKAKTHHEFEYNDQDDMDPDFRCPTCRQVLKYNGIR